MMLRAAAEQQELLVMSVFMVHVPGVFKEADCDEHKHVRKQW